MCLIGLAWQVSPRWPLVILGNREELHARESAPAQWWPDIPEVIGGRDLVTGGSWWACHRRLRVAAVINLFSGRPEASGHRSRGQLVRSWVRGEDSPSSFLDPLLADARAYRGFCLLMNDGGGWHAAVSSAGLAPRRWSIAGGITAFSNVDPTVRWPKVAYLEREMGHLLEQDALNPEAAFALLQRREVPVVPGSDAGGLRVSCQPFVVGPHYGTRTSTLLMVDSDGNAQFAERSFDPGGNAIGEATFHWSTTGSCRR